MKSRNLWRDLFLPFQKDCTLLAWDSTSNFVTTKIGSEVSGFLHHSFFLLNSECNSFILCKGVTRLNVTAGAHHTHTALSTENKIKTLFTTSLSTFCTSWLSYQTAPASPRNIVNHSFYLSCWEFTHQILLFCIRMQLHHESQ